MSRTVRYVVFGALIATAGTRAMAQTHGAATHAKAWAAHHQTAADRRPRIPVSLAISRKLA